MKKFSLKLFLFIFFLLIVFCLVSIVYFIRLNTVSFNLKKEIKCLFISDSHISVGVNSKFIPNSYNFAHSGDPYSNQYFRLEKMLQDNSQISIVFISATPVALSRTDENVPCSGYFMKEVLPYSLPFYDRELWVEYLKYEPQKFLRYGVFGTFHCSLELVFGFSKDSIMDRLGDNGDSISKNLEIDIRTRKTQIKSLKTSQNIIHVNGLKKMIELAKKRNVRLILLNTPIYNAKDYYDVPFFYETMQKEFPDVEF